MSETLSAVGSVVSGSVFSHEEGSSRHQKRFSNSGSSSATGSSIDKSSQSSSLTRRRTTDGIFQDPVSSAAITSDVVESATVPNAKELHNSSAGMDSGKQVALAVGEQLAEIASSIESSYTDSDKTKEAFITRMPDVVTRLRHLSAILAGGESLADYMSTYGQLRSYGKQEAEQGDTTSVLMESSVDLSKDDIVNSSTRLDQKSFDSDDSVPISPPRVNDSTVFDDNSAALSFDPEFSDSVGQISPIQVMYQSSIGDSSRQQSVPPLASLAVPKRLVLDKNATDSPL